MTDLEALPEPLIGPLLDAATVLLRALAADQVPVALRPLLAFDRRGLARGPARARLRRAIASDASFREQTFAVICALPEVQALVEEWRAPDALAVANAWADRDELPLLAAALLAAAPDGAEFGLGVVVAVDASRRGAHDDETDAKRLAARVVDLEEGLRRAESAKESLNRERERLDEQLRSERRVRRERDDRDAVDAQRIAELEGELAVARASVASAESARAQAVERARALEVELARARDAAAQSASAAAVVRDVGAASGSGVDAASGAEVEALASAARAARALAASLEQLAGSGRGSSAPPVPARPLPTSGDGDESTRRGGSASVRGPGPRGAAVPARGVAKRRSRPKLSGGLVADTVSGAVSMFRNAPALLVVDGYNVAKTAGAGASLELERESLLRGLESLHLTTGVDVIVVFDGDGTQTAGKPRRPVVRVVFSAPGEEADSVIVEIVAATPLPTPVVVASSDHWVREHSETFGAVVISAATLVAVLRQPPGRPTL